MAKDDKSVDARLYLPRTKTFSFELELQLQRGTREGEDGFPAVKRYLVRYENAKQSKSKLGLLLHGCQLPNDADLLKFLKAYKKVLSV